MKFDLTPPKGTKDIASDQAKKLWKIIETCKQVFESFGFEPLFTPAFEKFEILSAKGGLGEAVKEEIYYFKDKAGRELGLRFDLTMPLARFVSANPQIPKPFKRYAIAPVWRYDNPQRLRYREFWQADIDIVGSSSILADVECLACVCEVLNKLEIKNFKIRVNNRVLIENLLKPYAGNKIKQVFRIIDKLDKIGEECVKKELEEIDINSEKIMEIITMDISEINQKGKEEIEKLFELASFYGIEKFLKIDLSLVRGLDYYTSLVYEIYIEKENLSFGGGGRYDNLIEILSSRKIPATGISLGITRLMEILSNDFFKKQRKLKFLVTVLENSMLKYYIEICKAIRDQGFICEFDVMERNLRKQLDYANSKAFDFVIFFGKKEKEKNVIKLRNMQTGEEKEIPFQDIRCLSKYIS
ncbi:MAG TPA: histidine--tRNA ligase [Nanoarchaeota archaeon]|nr:histidine--tRNA ligase [Nanoarchaeota archaeon]